MNEELLLNETEETTETTKRFDAKSAGIGAGLGLLAAGLAGYGFKKAKTAIKRRKAYKKVFEDTVDADVEYEEVINDEEPVEE